MCIVAKLEWSNKRSKETSDLVFSHTLIHQLKHVMWSFLRFQRMNESNERMIALITKQ